MSPAFCVSARRRPLSAGTATRSACRRRPAAHARQNDRDVIFSAGVVGRVDQRRARRGQRLVPVQQLADALVVEHVGQAVGAQQVDVARHHLVHVGLEQHGVFDADGARHQVLVRRERRLLGGDEPGVDLLLQQRMVVRGLRQPPAAQAVGARIADVPEQQPPCAEHRDDERRAHAGVLRVGVGGVEDRAVGVVDADVHRAAHLGVGRVWPRPLQPAPEFGLDERGGHAAGHLAGVVAAHAVGQRQQLRGLVHRHRILVVVARAAGVGRAEEFKGHGSAVARGGDSLAGIVPRIDA